MIANLDEVLRVLLAQALPDLLAGSPPPVRLTIRCPELDFDLRFTDATAGQPATDDQTDSFSFDANQPSGPYTLTRLPYPGLQRVWLVSRDGDHISLLDSEVAWNPGDPRTFNLNLQPGRDLNTVTKVEALYAVTAVFTTMIAVETWTVELESVDTSADKLAAAEALTLAVLQLNRKEIINRAKSNHQDGDYSTDVTVTNLKLLKGTNPTSTTCLLTLLVDVEIKASRALKADEGKPIQYIIRSGQSANAKRPVDPEIRLDM